MSSPVEVLPCPYCGNKPGTLFLSFDIMPNTYITVCYLCKEEPKFHGRGGTEQDSLKDWNKMVKGNP